MAKAIKTTVLSLFYTIHTCRKNKPTKVFTRVGTHGQQQSVLSITNRREGATSAVTSSTDVTRCLHHHQLNSNNTDCHGEEQIDCDSTMEPTDCRLTTTDNVGHCWNQLNNYTDAEMPDTTIQFLDACNQRNNEHGYKQNEPLNNLCVRVPGLFETNLETRSRNDSFVSDRSGVTQFRSEQNTNQNFDCQTVMKQCPTYTSQYHCLFSEFLAN